MSLGYFFPINIGISSPLISQSYSAQNEHAVDFVLVSFCLLFIHTSTACVLLLQFWLSSKFILVHLLTPTLAKQRIFITLRAKALAALVRDPDSARQSCIECRSQLKLQTADGKQFFCPPRHKTQNYSYFASSQQSCRMLNR